MSDTSVITEHQFNRGLDKAQIQIQAEMNKDVGFEMQSVQGLNLVEENDQLMNIVNESTILYEVGLNGKPVINTI